MKKTIVLMLVLVLALSVFMFTACDKKDGDEGGKGSSAGVVFNESMTYEEALAAVQADSEFKGYTFYSETYDEDGNQFLDILINCFDDNYWYYVYFDSGPDYGSYTTITIYDFKELKYYNIFDEEGKELVVYYYEELDQEDVSDIKEQIIEERDESIEDFYDSIESGADWETTCDPEAHFTTKFEGTSLTFICECGNCRYAYKNFNATYTLPEKYSNYKSIAKLYVDGD